MTHTTTTKTDQRPTCCDCGSRNVETTAWIDYDADGVAHIVDGEGPHADETGNWCHDCQEHVYLNYPDTTPDDDARRQAAAAARDAGAELVAVLRRLRSCPDLHLDDLEPETIAAIEAADEMLSRCAPAIRRKS